MVTSKDALGASRWGLSRWHRLLKSYLERPIYVPLVAVIAGLNAFLPFFPVELFVALRVLIRANEWWRLAILAAVASALGTLALAHLIESQPHAELASWLALQIGQTRWEKVSEFVRLRGSIGLTLVAISYLPLPPAVVMCVMSKIPNWEIALSIGIGNGLKYVFFSWLAAHSPHWFRGAERLTSSSP